VPSLCIHELWRQTFLAKPSLPTLCLVGAINIISLKKKLWNAFISFTQLEGHKTPILQGRDKFIQPFTIQVLPEGVLCHSSTWCAGFALRTLGDWLTSPSSYILHWETTRYTMKTQNNLGHLNKQERFQQTGHLSRRSQLHTQDV